MPNIGSASLAFYMQQTGEGYGFWFLLIIVFLIIIVVGYYLIAIYPNRSIPPPDKEFHVKDRLELLNDYRATAAQIVGGFLVLLGLFGTGFSINESRKLYQLSQRGQEAERFSKSIELIKGTDELSRTGGIFSLESIADTNKADYRWPVINVFATYVRKYSCPEKTGQQGPAEAKNEQATGQTRWTGGVPCPNQQQPQVVSSDIQEILSFIKSDQDKGANVKPEQNKDANLIGLNLSQTNLREADMTKGNFEHVLFKGIYGLLANFNGADLKGANFQQADSPSNAVADLTSAIFTDAHLEGARFNNATLRQANFYGAIIDESTTFNGADLSGANFEGTAITQEQVNSAKIDVNTRLPSYIKRP